jgi:hypothetical protein
VTTIIQATTEQSGQIEGWKRRNGNWETLLKQSQLMGTIIHYRILNELSARTLELPEHAELDCLPEDALTRVEIADGMFGGLSLRIGHPRRIEELAVNHEKRYAGKPDLVAPIALPSENGNEPIYTLVDLKTSKNIYETHKLQLGGYYGALGRTPERGMVISLNCDERSNPHLRAHYLVMSKDELDSYCDRFLDLVDVFYSYGYEKSLLKDEYKVEPGKHDRDF